MRPTERPGYTLFQLILLLAVLLLLMGLFLPRLFMARRRMQTINNLRQIGIAMHAYHDTNGALPAGVDDRYFSAFAKILPYIEQDNVSKIIDFTKNADSDDNAPAREIIIRLFLSASDPVTHPVEKAGATSYQLVAGTRPDLKDNDGIFYLNSKLTLGMITVADGTSNTLMAIETLKGDGQKKAESVARQHVRLKKAELKTLKEESGVKDFENNKNIASNRGSSWIDGRFLQATTTITREFNSTRPDVDCEGAGGLAAPRSLEDGTFTLFADGSLHFTSEKTSLKVWKAIATRNGGEVFKFD